VPSYYTPSLRASAGLSCSAEGDGLATLCRRTQQPAAGSLHVCTRREEPAHTATNQPGCRCHASTFQPGVSGAYQRHLPLRAAAIAGARGMASSSCAIRASLWRPHASLQRARSTPAHLRQGDGAQGRRRVGQIHARTEHALEEELSPEELSPLTERVRPFPHHPCKGPLGGEPRALLHRCIVGSAYGLTVGRSVGVGRVSEHGAGKARGGAQAGARRPAGAIRHRAGGYAGSQVLGEARPPRPSQTSGGAGSQLR
jgi:hypothetical protein